MNICMKEVYDFLLLFFVQEMYDFLSKKNGVWFSFLICRRFDWPLYYGPTTIIFVVEYGPTITLFYVKNNITLIELLTCAKFSMQQPSEWYDY